VPDSLRAPTASAADTAHTPQPAPAPEGAPEAVSEAVPTVETEDPTGDAS